MATPIPLNDAALDAWAAAAATDGSVVRLASAEGTARAARGIVSDTRQLRAGTAFVALRGARFDGHTFVGEAVTRGAALIICGRGEASRLPDPARADVVEVEDTLVAWGALARAHLRQYRRGGGRVLALTGSAGKTTTKELAAALLGCVGPVHATFGNLNNRIGVPAVAFGATSSSRFCVIEAGMSEPGEIAAIAAFTEPDVALVLNATLAHAGGVGGSRADVAREKGALFAALERSGIAVANADDEAVMGQLARTRASRAVTFGTSESADYRLVARRARPVAPDAPAESRSGSEVEFLTPHGPCSVEVPIAGAAAALDLVAAWASAEALTGARLDPAAAQSALLTSGLETALGGRMRLVALASGALLLDDSYNASPASVANALATLAELAVRHGRRPVVVLGEMRELGEQTTREHVQVGELVADARVALLISAGGAAVHASRSSRARGVEAFDAADADEAATLLLSRLEANDLVLVKGSRGAATDRVVRALEERWPGRGRRGVW